MTWISGLFNPQAFLTAVMQVTARKNEWPLDKVQITVDVTKKGPEEIEGATRDGAYIHGLFVEGARWDSSTGSLEAACEAALAQAATLAPLSAGTCWLILFYLIQLLAYSALQSIQSIRFVFNSFNSRF